MKTIGQPESFAFGFGPGNNTAMRVVDIFVSGVSICVFDNNAYAPQFRSAIQCDLDRLQTRDADRYRQYFVGLTPEQAHGKIKQLIDIGKPVEWLNGDDPRRHFGFLDWGPTTDGVLSYLIPIRDSTHLTLEFVSPTHPENGRILTVEVGTSDLAKILAEAVAELTLD